MRSQLTQVEGVENVAVDYGAKTATVHVRPGTDPQAVANGLHGKFSGTVQ